MPNTVNPIPTTVHRPGLTRTVLSILLSIELASGTFQNGTT